MTTRAAVLVLALLAAACTTPGAGVGVQRATNRTALEADGAALGGATGWTVFADGEVRGRGESLDDALRAARGADAGADAALHRFVFQPGDEQPRDLRLAFLPRGGRVAGRGLAQALGMEIEEGATHAVTLIRAGRRVRLAVDDGRLLRLEVAAPDGTQARLVDVPFDPDFDGGLLLDTASAQELGLARFEKPGDGLLRVALGRPFGVLRATVRVRVPALEAEGLVEAAHPGSARPR